MKKTSSKLKKTISVLIIFALIFTCGSTMSLADTNKSYAETVFVNGVIYTVDGADWDTTPVQSMAVDEDGIIMYVGSNSGAMAFVGGDTDVIDLGGKAVLPGFVDAHVHATGIAQNLSGLGSSIFLTVPHELDKIEADILSFVSRTPLRNSYSGGNFAMSSFPAPTGTGNYFKDATGFDTPALWLDHLSGGKPVSLTSTDGHNRLVSQSLLDLNSITPASITGDLLGVVPTYEVGGVELVWGTLSGSTATGLIRTMGPANPPTPPLTEAENRQVTLFFQDYYFERGITSIFALSGDAVIRRMIALEQLGDWHMRINVGQSFSNPTNRSNFNSTFANFLENKEFYAANSDLVRLTTAKFFVDNVVEGGSAWLLEPYMNNPNPLWRSVPRQNVLDPMDYSAPLPQPTQEPWHHFVSELTANDIQIHVHAIGDAAIRATLDTIELAQIANPGKEMRHTITHLHIVHADDIPRFGQLGVVASTQPYWHPKDGEAPGWYESMDVAFVGEHRSSVGYPVKSFIDTGAVVAFSSDHPVTADPNPFVAIEIGVTRNKPSIYLSEPSGMTDWNDPEFLRNPAERISLKQSVEAYTINGAYQLFREDEIGSLIVGKYADMIVIDQDIMKLSGNGFLEISKTKVLATIIAGKTVYGDPGDLIGVNTAGARVYASPVNHIGGGVDFFLEIRDASNVIAVEMEFEVDGEMLSAAGIEGLEGFSVLDEKWTPLANDIWRCNVVIGLPSGGASEFGYDFAVPTDIAKFKFDAKAPGDTTLKVTNFTLVGYNEATDEVERYGVRLDENEITVTIIDKYDLNRDGKVDLLDLGIMLLYVGYADTDTEWDTLIKVNDKNGVGITAERCDVNGDGEVDMADLVELLANFT